MLSPRIAIHLLLAVILVINGVASVAMAAGMAADVDSTSALGGCHETAAKASTPDGVDDVSPSGSACCVDGRCACACVHHSTVATTALPPIPMVVAWPALPSPGHVAPLSQRLSPHFRPPIALIS